MEFELIHFPDFQNSFFGKEYCATVLETYRTARQRLSCKHITHITPKHAYSNSEKDSVLSVISTVPADWIVNYAAKNYFDIDPLFHQKWSNSPVVDSFSITEIYSEKQNTLLLQNFVDDMRTHKFAASFVMVTHNLNNHQEAHTIFAFDNPKGQKCIDAVELIRLLEKDLVQAANQIHQAVSTVIRHHSDHKKEVQSLVVLTPREIDCLKWAARGKTDGEIAEILSIARWTVVTYLQNAKIKLGCSNRTSAVAVAMSLGIIPLPDTSHLQV